MCLKPLASGFLCFGLISQSQFAVARLLGRLAFCPLVLMVRPFQSLGTLPYRFRTCTQNSEALVCLLSAPSSTIALHLFFLASPPLHFYFPRFSQDNFLSKARSMSSSTHVAFPFAVKSEYASATVPFLSCGSFCVSLFELLVGQPDHNSLLLPSGAHLFFSLNFKTWLIAPQALPPTALRVTHLFCSS